MAATSLATMLDTIRDSVDAALVWEFFVKPDPLAGRCPAPRYTGGYRKLMDYISTSSDASPLGFYGTMTQSAFTKAQYQMFLNMIYKQDQRNTAISSLGEGQQGRSDRLTKKMEIFRMLSKLFRQYLVKGEPAYDAGTSYGTGAIGATLQALLGADATFEAGPRTFDFDDVHPQSGALTATTLGKFKWTNATASLQYMAPGDSYYGPAQVISASNYYRVPLFSGIDSSNNPNPTKWCRVTLDPVSTILAAGNYESDTTAAKGVTFTVTGQPTGWYRQVSPIQQVFGDLTGAADETGDDATGNGPAGGYSANRANLSWMVQRLLDASNDDPSRCAILAPDGLHIHLEGLITSLGQGAPTTMFMGQELDALNYRRIPILRNNFLPTNLSSRDGNRSDLTCMLGVVLGEDNAHYEWSTPAADVTTEQQSDIVRGAQVMDDGTPTGTAMPLYYEEKRSAATDLIVNQTGLMIFEPTAKLQDLCMVTELYNG